MYQLAYDLRRKYGLTIAQYEGMLAAQKGICPICKSDMNPPNIDHNHTTGEVRGLLCTVCNQGLGLFGDNVGRLRNAARYLEENDSHYVR